ncbi:MAG TPA: alpha/beta hydrolase [Vicinamibacterales bacterium]|nr:alpha/beta hydrolase [Vicinamibacterales bacterium]
MKNVLPLLVVLSITGTLVSAMSQLSAQPTDRFLEVNGLRIHYVDWGGEGKPPFVMVHGLDRVARTFDHLATRFTSKYRVLAIDMRGHGDSGWDPQGRYLVEDHVGDLEGVVGQLELRDLVLWGNSTGGRVVQVFAGKHPELVSRVISEDVGPERPRQIADNYAKRVQQEQAGWASQDELLAQLRKSNPRMSPAVLEPYVRYGTKKRADGRIEWKRDPQLVKGFVATELWRYVRNIKAPILYIIGGRSNIVPPETQDELRKVLPNAQLVTIPDVGHYPSDEKTDEVVTIVNRFLAGEKIGG